MKTQFIGSALLSLAYLAMRAFAPLKMSASLGAKSGVITAPTGSDTNMRTLGDSSPATDTIAGVVRSALGLVAALKGVIINFLYGDGKAIIVPTGYADPAPSGYGVLGTFEKDDPTKASSPWTFTPGASAQATVSTVCEGLIEARKPSMSVESLTNAIDDAVADLTTEMADYGAGIVHYDQADGIIQICTATTPAAYDPAAGYTEEAAFVRTLAAAGSSQFGE